jgi:hypothetical protein
MQAAKSPSKYKNWNGCPIRLLAVLEPCSHDLGGLQDAAPSRFVCLYGGSERQRIQGDNRVPTLETRQDVLRHLLR